MTLYMSCFSIQEIAVLNNSAILFTGSKMSFPFSSNYFSFNNSYCKIHGIASPCSIRPVLTQTMPFSQNSNHFLYFFWSVLLQLLLLLYQRNIAAMLIIFASRCSLLTNSTIMIESLLCSSVLIYGSLSSWRSNTCYIFALMFSNESYCILGT